MMMKTVLDFFSFSDPNILYVVVGSILLASSSAVIGVFIVLKKKALIGDAVSHSVLPGICMAFLFSYSKNITLLIIGAFVSGWLAVLAIDYITRKTKIKKDAAISIALTVFFGFGVVLLTYIQHNGYSSQSGLESFIFGNAAALIGSDVVVFSIIAIVLVMTVVLFFKELVLTSFDEPYAQTIGLPVRRLELLLTTLTVLAVVTGITAVGVVLMSAMLVTPAAAARFWSDNIKKIVVIAAFFGALSGLAGAFISYMAPAMPTGPWMVVASSVIAFFSFFFAPRKGAFVRWWLKKRHQRITDDENILKVFYQLMEKKDATNFSLTEVASQQLFNKRRIAYSFKRLKAGGLIEEVDRQWRLTEIGVNKAKRIVRLHRLWELYLTKYVQIASDKVHQDAEMIEHILTPDIEKELEIQLGFPDRDPHQSIIPRI